MSMARFLCDLSSGFFGCFIAPSTPFAISLETVVYARTETKIQTESSKSLWGNSTRLPIIIGTSFRDLLMLF